MHEVKIKIIGQQGEDSGRYMLGYGIGKARIADLDSGVLWPMSTLGSIMEGGNWHRFEHDEELLQKLLKLPEVKYDT